jgi:hypothetical protein
MVKPWAQMSISEKLSWLQQELREILRQEGHTCKDAEEALLSRPDQQALEEHGASKRTG